MPADDEQLCTQCNKSLPPEHVLCSVNGCKLHFACAGILEATWRKNSNKQNWKCPECKKSKSLPESSIPTELRAFLDSISQQLKVLEDLKPLTTLVPKLEESVTFMSKKYDELSVRFNDMEAKCKEQDKQIQLMQKELAEKDKHISHLQERMVSAEQYARNRNIEICNVEERPGEDLHQIMKILAQNIEVPLNEGDIDVIHRVPTASRGAPPKIIVQFTTRTIRERWLAKRHQAISSQILVPSVSVVKSVYINRHLAEHWRTLLWEAKQKGRPLGYKLVWFKDNKIMAKKNVDDRRIIYIHNKSDLDKLV